jgi:hypothetical protein
MRYYSIRHEGRELMQIYAPSAREAKLRAQKELVHRWREICLPRLEAC